MSFDKHLNRIIRSNSPEYSPSLLEYMKSVHERFNISMASFFSFGYISSEELIKAKINDLIRKQHRLQFHNVGHNPWLRYFSMDNHYPWLHLEQYLIQHMYSINKSESHISNKKIAIALGWISKKESDPEVIKKACRKVTDNLNILKTVRKSFNIEQKYNYGKKGSYHLITADWLVIMNLYQSYSLEKGQSIRFRKSIKYRIISLISKFTRKFSNALAELMKKQKRYLKELLNFNLEDFQDLKLYLFNVFDYYWDIIIPDSKKGLFIPNYHDDDKTIILEIKDRVLYDELDFAGVDLGFKDKWGINLKLVANF